MYGNSIATTMYIILTNTLRWSCIVCNQRFADTGELLHPPVNREREVLIEGGREWEER